MAVHTVSFKTKYGPVSFKAGHKTKSSRKPNKYAKFIKSFAKSHKNLKGPALFKSASKQWKKSQKK
jgi:hypothetical protein